MKAMRTMSALAQPTRLAAYEHLVAALPDGLGAGDIAEFLGISPNGMSAHLAILSRAGLVTSVKSGRSVIYTAMLAPVEELGDFLARVRSSQPGPSGKS